MYLFSILLRYVTLNISNNANRTKESFGLLRPIYYIHVHFVYLHFLGPIDKMIFVS
jgi:hypothetical protein